MAIGEVLAVVFGLATAGAISLIIRDKWTFLNPPTPVKKSKYAAFDAETDALGLDDSGGGDIIDVQQPPITLNPSIDLKGSLYVPGRPDPPRVGGNKKIGADDPSVPKSQSIDLDTDTVESFVGDEQSAYDTGVLNFLPGVGADTPSAGEVGIPQQTMEPDIYATAPDKLGGALEGLPEGGTPYPQSSNEQALKDELSILKGPGVTNLRNPTKNARCVVNGKQVKGRKCFENDVEKLYDANPNSFEDDLGNFTTLQNKAPTFKTNELETFYATRLAVSYGD